MQGTVIHDLDCALRLLDHLWGRIEVIKSRGAYLSQDQGAAKNKTRVSKPLLTELKHAGFIEHDQSEQYFHGREIFTISQLGMNRIRGTRPFRVCRRHE